MALLALGSLWCGYALLRERALWTPSPSRTILIAWIGAALTSSIFGLDPLAGVQVVAVMVLGGCFHLALVRYYKRAAVARTVTVAYLCAGIVACVAGIGMALTHVPAGLYAVTHGRAAGFFVDANQFAEFLDLFVFVALGAALGSRDPFVRRLGALGALVGLAALVLTFSREALAGAAAAAIFLAFALGRRAAGVALLAGTALAVVALLFRPFPHHDPSDSFSRLRTIESGLRVASLFPLTGVGPVTYWRVYPAVRPINAAEPGTFGALHPHDVYVSLTGELGLAGLAAGVFGWLRFAADFRRRLAAAAGSERRLALGVCAGFVALAVSGVLDTIGIVQMTFVWIPYSALALAATEVPA
jgi:O-antigen ligase